MVLIQKRFADLFVAAGLWSFGLDRIKRDGKSERAVEATAERAHLFKSAGVTIQRIEQIAIAARDELDVMAFLKQAQRENQPDYKGEGLPSVLPIALKELKRPQSTEPVVASWLVGLFLGAGREA